MPIQPNPHLHRPPLSECWRRQSVLYQGRLIKYVRMPQQLISALCFRTLKICFVVKSPFSVPRPDGPRLYAPRLYVPRLYVLRLYVPRFDAPRFDAPRSDAFRPDAPHPDVVQLNEGLLGLAGLRPGCWKQTLANSARPIGIKTIKVWYKAVKRKMPPLNLRYRIAVGGFREKAGENDEGEV